MLNEIREQVEECRTIYDYLLERNGSEDIYVIKYKAN